MCPVCALCVSFSHPFGYSFTPSLSLCLSSFSFPFSCSGRFRFLFFFCDIISQASSSASSLSLPLSTSSSTSGSLRYSSSRAHSVRVFATSVVFPRDAPLSSLLVSATSRSSSVFTSFSFRVIRFPLARVSLSVLLRLRVLWFRCYDLVLLCFYHGRF